MFATSTCYKNNEDSLGVTRGDATECTCLYPVDENIEENVEPILSNRNVLIEMLHEQITKKENLYKDLTNEYEHLRCKYCSLVQQFSNYKEILRKLEEENAKLYSEQECFKNCQKTLNDYLKKELQVWQDQYKQLQHKQYPCAEFKEKIANIEKFLLEQNFTCTDIFAKCLNELKNLKPMGKVTACRSSLTVPYVDPNHEELKNENEHLVKLTEKLQNEKECAKRGLKEKQEHIENCMCVLEKNHRDITSLSENINYIVKEKDKYYEEICCLRENINECGCKLEKKDQEITSLKDEINDLNCLICQKDKEISNMKQKKSIPNSVNLSKLLHEYISIYNELDSEIQHKETECNTCTCQLKIYLIRLKENNRILTNEITNISEQQNEKIEMKARCGNFHVPASEKNTFENVKESQSPNSKTDCKSKTELANEYSQIKNCKCKLFFQVKTVSTEDTSKGNETELDNSQIEKDLQAAKLEINECKKDNKCYQQQIESLKAEIAQLKCCKAKVKENDGYDNNIKTLKNTYTNELSKKDKCIENLKKEIEVLAKFKENYYIVSKENEQLKGKVSNMEKMLTEKTSIRNENKHLRSCDCHEPSLKNNSENNNVVILENQLKELQEIDNNKEQQLKNAFTELNNIQKQLEQDYEEKHKLKLQIISLQSKIQELSLNAYVKCHIDCSCDELKVKIMLLTEELCKRDCVINKLEQCVDESNIILAECEIEIRTLNSKNKCLKQQVEDLKIENGKTLQSVPNNIQPEAVECACQEKKKLPLGCICHGQLICNFDETNCGQCRERYNLAMEKYETNALDREPDVIGNQNDLQQVEQHLQQRTLKMSLTCSTGSRFSDHNDENSSCMPMTTVAECRQSNISKTISYISGCSQNVPCSNQNTGIDLSPIINTVNSVPYKKSSSNYSKQSYQSSFTGDRSIPSVLPVQSNASKCQDSRNTFQNIEKTEKIPDDNTSSLKSKECSRVCFDIEHVNKQPEDISAFNSTHQRPSDMVNKTYSNCQVCSENLNQTKIAEIPTQIHESCTAQSLLSGCLNSSKYSEQNSLNSTGTNKEISNDVISCTQSTGCSNYENMYAIQENEETSFNSPQNNRPIQNERFRVNCRKYTPKESTMVPSAYSNNSQMSKISQSMTSKEISCTESKNCSNMLNYNNVNVNNVPSGSQGSKQSQNLSKDVAIPCTEYNNCLQMEGENVYEPKNNSSIIASAQHSFPAPSDSQGSKKPQYTSIPCTDSNNCLQMEDATGYEPKYDTTTVFPISQSQGSKNPEYTAIPCTDSNNCLQMEDENFYEPTATVYPNSSESQDSQKPQHVAIPCSDFNNCLQIDENIYEPSSTVASVQHGSPVRCHSPNCRKSQRVSNDTISCTDSKNCSRMMQYENVYEPPAVASVQNGSPVRCHSPGCRKSQNITNDPISCTESKNCSQMKKYENFYEPPAVASVQNGSPIRCHSPDCRKSQRISNDTISCTESTNCSQMMKYDDVYEPRDDTSAVPSIQHGSPIPCKRYQKISNDTISCTESKNCSQMMKYENVYEPRDDPSTIASIQHGSPISCRSQDRKRYQEISNDTISCTESKNCSQIMNCENVYEPRDDPSTIQHGSPIHRYSQDYKKSQRVSNDTISCTESKNCSQMMKYGNVREPRDDTSPVQLGFPLSNRPGPPIGCNNATQAENVPINSRPCSNYEKYSDHLNMDNNVENIKPSNRNDYLMPSCVSKYSKKSQNSGVSHTEKLVVEVEANESIEESCSESKNCTNTSNSDNPVIPTESCVCDSFESNMRPTENQGLYQNAIEDSKRRSKDLTRPPIGSKYSNVSDQCCSSIVPQQVRTQDSKMKSASSKDCKNQKSIQTTSPKNEHTDVIVNLAFSSCVLQSSSNQCDSNEFTNTAVRCKNVKIRKIPEISIRPCNCCPRGNIKLCVSSAEHADKLSKRNPKNSFKVCQQFDKQNTNDTSVANRNDDVKTAEKNVLNNPSVSSEKHGHISKDIDNKQRHNHCSTCNPEKSNAYPTSILPTPRNKSRNSKNYVEPQIPREVMNCLSSCTKIKMLNCFSKKSDKVCRVVASKLRLELKKRNESIKLLKNDKTKLLLDIKTLDQTVREIAKDNNDLKCGISILLSDIISKLKLVTNKGENASTSTDSLKAEILQSLTHLEQALVEQTSFNSGYTSEIDSYYKASSRSPTKIPKQPDVEIRPSSEDFGDISDFEAEKDQN